MTALIVLVLLLLAACSSSVQTSARQQTPTTGTLLGGTTQSGPFPPRFNTDADAPDTGVLQVHIDALTCGAWLVLKDTKRQYTTADLAQMSQYAQAHTFFPFTSQLDDAFKLGGIQGIGGTESPRFPYFPNAQLSFENPSPAGVPNILEWAAGGTVCVGALEVTNTGSNPAVISAVGATLAEDAIPNTFSYSLVDLCTLVVSQTCPTQEAGASASCIYYSNLQLLGGSAGEHVEVPLVGSPAIPEANSTCPLPLTLAPQQEQDIVVGFTSNPQHMIYSVNLTLTVGGVRGTLSDNHAKPLTQYLAFVDSTTTSACYGLQGSMFVRESPVTASGSGGHVCV